MLAILIGIIRLLRKLIKYGAKPNWSLGKTWLENKAFIFENFNRWEKENKTLECLTSFTSIWALNSSINSFGSVDHAALRYSLLQAMGIAIRHICSNEVLSTLPNNWGESMHFIIPWPDLTSDLLVPGLLLNR